MRRLLGVAFLLMSVTGCMPMGELGASTAALNLVPDPNYNAHAGDRAWLYAMTNGAPAEQIPVLSDMTAYDKYERCLQADDPLELANMEQQSHLQYVALGTPVYIAKISDRKHTGAHVGAEVKILDGPQKGRVVWTSLSHIARLKRPEPVE
jgi:hypothetical protein